MRLGQRASRADIATRRWRTVKANRVWPGVSPLIPWLHRQSLCRVQIEKGVENEKAVLGIPWRRKIVSRRKEERGARSRQGRQAGALQGDRGNRSGRGRSLGALLRLHGGS